MRSLSLTLAAFLHSILSIASTIQKPTTQHLSTFPVFIENIAVRSDGHVLLTSLNLPTILAVDPVTPNTTTTLPAIPGNVNGIGGIAEPCANVFVVHAGLWNTTARRAQQGTMSLWSVDFRASLTNPVLEKLVDIKEATALNGLTAVPGNPNLVLVSESDLGAIYTVDISRKAYQISLQDPILEPLGPSPSLGINGIHTYKSHVYFASSDRGVFGRVPLSPKTGTFTGAVENIATFNTTEQTPDDFAVDAEGVAWMGSHPNSLLRIDGEGRVTSVLSGDVIEHPTSLAFGRDRRGRREEKVVFVNTNVISESGFVGGVVRVDLR